MIFDMQQKIENQEKINFLTPLCDLNLDEDIIHRQPFNQTIFDKSIKLAQRLHAEKYAKSAIGKIQREVVI